MKEMADVVQWPGWETVKLIGRGSFGAVYEIQRDVLGDIEKAALKVISIPQNDGDIDEMYNDGYDDESITSTFQSHLKSIVAEYSLMRKMNGCTNIVNCDDVRYVQHDDGIGWDIFIKMELLTPLAKALPADAPEETVIKIARDMCAALELCRKFGIVHRDIKPQNIFVSDLGDYKLGDFGIAKTVEKTMGGTKIGTYKYMAPEVYNNQPYGCGADIYSLGLVLYWLLNERRMPFLPLPPAKLTVTAEDNARNRRFSGEPLPPPAHGSEKLKRIVLKACAYDPKERYQSAAEMLQVLNDETEGEALRKHKQSEEEMFRELQEKREAARKVQEEQERIRLEQEQLAREREEAERQMKLQEERNRIAKEREAAEGEKLRRQKELQHKQEEDQPPAQPEKRKGSPVIWVLGIAVAVAVLIWLGNWHNHSWSPATCQQPETCAICGETRGTILGHNWTNATCTKTETCTICGETRGTTLSHDWADATCTKPATCKNCGATEGEALEHQWNDATCSEPKTCKTCEKISGSALGHDWSHSDCTRQSRCQRCEEIGDYGEHQWEEGDSSVTKTCICCNRTVEYCYYEDSLIAWTEYIPTQNEVITYTSDGQVINWYRFGSLRLWCFSDNTLRLFFADGNVYYCYCKNHVFSDNELHYLANVASWYFWYDTYRFGTSQWINLVVREADNDLDVGQAVLAYDVYGNEYVILHYGESDTDPTQTIVLESTRY